MVENIICNVRQRGKMIGKNNNSYFNFNPLVFGVLKWLFSSPSSAIKDIDFMPR